MLITATTAIIDTILDELETHLPAQLVAYDMPAVREWLFGDRELTAITNTPSIQVDVADYEQGDGWGNITKRQTDFVILAVLTAPDPDTLHRQLIAFGDILTAVLESDVTLDGSTKLAVTGVDFSPSFRMGSSLHRAVAVEARLANKLHTRGTI